MQIAVTTGLDASNSTGTRQTVRWSAVIAGWLVAAGIADLFYIAGLAIGFTAFDATDARRVSDGIGVGAALWMVLTWAVSLFLGGMFASWFDRSGDRTVGTMHGVAVWALAVTATAALMALGVADALPSGGALLHPVNAGKDAAVTALSEAARDYTAKALWVLYASTFLAMIAAALGGWTGAGHEQQLFGDETYRARERVGASDEYEPRMG
jgi:hypothetical protein